MKILVSAILAFLLIGIGCTAQNGKSADEIKGIEVGPLAPLFKATDQNGETFLPGKTLKEGPIVIQLLKIGFAELTNFARLLQLSNNERFTSSSTAWFATTVDCFGIDTDNHNTLKKITWTILSVYSMDQFVASEFA